MIVRPKARLVAPLVAMSMALMLAASASAGTGVSLQINFGTTPHWSRVPGTQVREVRQEDRSDYDVFQYGRSYYAYDYRNDRWYRSRRSSGHFRMIDDRAVPRDLRRVPRNHWRNYPASWQGRDDRYDQGSSRYGGSSRYDRGSDNSSGILRVTFGSTPRWGSINGTRVETIPMADRRDYDVFRYDNTYYAYDSNRWYSSPRETGDFTVIDDRAVPSEFSRVPRDQWHSYPAAWQNQNPNGTPPGQDRRNGIPPGQQKKDRNHRGSGY